MQVQIFRNEAGAFALTTKESGQDLPAALGPWRRLKRVTVEEKKPGRIDLSPDEIATRRRDHIVLLPNGLVIDDV